MCKWKTEQEKVECNSSTECCIYNLPDTRPSCDANGHKNRTLGNDTRPNGHQEHWKKEDKKVVN